MRWSRSACRTDDALAACGGNVRLSVYPDVAHDSWTDTYANPELYTWLLSHSRATQHWQTDAP